MPITKAGIEALGFTPMPSGTVIEAFFTSIIIYSVEGINHEELISQHSPNISYLGEEFSFSFASSVNEVLEKMFNDYSIDDELSWAKNHGARPPYFIICIRLGKPFYCSAGYWKTNKDVLLTHDCFPNAKEALKKMENRIVPSLLSCLMVQFNKIHKPVMFRLLEKEAYAQTSKGIKLVDFRIEFTGSGYAISGISSPEVRDVIAGALGQYPQFEPRIASLFLSGMQEEDRLKKFLNLWMALERYTHLTFSKIDFERIIEQNTIKIPIRLKETVKDLVIENLKSKTLKQRFVCCAVFKWENLVDSDVSKFRQMKKYRDRFMHGEEIFEQDLPVEDLKDLLFKILT